MNQLKLIRFAVLIIFVLISHMDASVLQATLFTTFVTSFMFHVYIKNEQY